MLDPKHVAEIVTENAGYRAQNAELIDIFEGNLCQYIDEDMKKQFSPQSLEQARHRVAPINILPKVIDKLTNIYQTCVSREVIDGSKSDQELVDWFTEKMRANSQMNSANELFNLSKACLIGPYLDKEGTPGLRVVLNDRFIAVSDDPICPHKPTYIILLAGKVNGKAIYHTYSDTQFMISNDKGEIETQMMFELGNPEGINEYGRIPYTYVNESKYRVQPKLDSDTLKIVKLVPVMITDLNVAAMFQSFSIIYGIDVNDENLKMAPNAFWRLKSEANSDKKPEIGQIKPQVDYDQVLGLIQSELSLWLFTKGIRPGAVGTLTADNFASGISKMIDEMDTYEAREKQVEYFKVAEKDLWDLILKHMHPYWVSEGLIENRAEFSPDASVMTSFAVQLPMQTRGQVVKDIREEFESGFTSRKRAIMKLNPELNENEILELMKEIDLERTIIQEEEPQEAKAEETEDDTEAA